MSSQIENDLPTDLKPEEFQTEMDKILSNHIVNRHSYFQLKHFVVGKEYTVQSCMWRCIRELQARHESMIALQDQIEDLKDNVELHALQIERINKEKCDNEIDTKEQKLKIRKLERQIKITERDIDTHEKKYKEAKEEAVFLVMAYQQLAKKEPLLPFDDIISQTDYWNAKLSQELNLRMLTHSPLDLELVKTILSLDDKTPIKQQTLHILQDSKIQLQKTINKAIEQDDPGIVEK